MYRYLAELAEAQGITMYRVAKDTGIPAATLYNWKAGRYTPKVDKIKRLAEYFHVTLEDFLAHSDN